MIGHINCQLFFSFNGDSWRPNVGLTLASPLTYVLCVSFVADIQTVANKKKFTNASQVYQALVNFFTNEAEGYSVSIYNKEYN